MRCNDMQQVMILIDQLITSHHTHQPPTHTFLVSPLHPPLIIIINTKNYYRRGKAWKNPTGPRCALYPVLPSYSSLSPARPLLHQFQQGKKEKKEKSKQDQSRGTRVPSGRGSPLSPVEGWRWRLGGAAHGRFLPYSASGTGVLRWLHHRKGKKGRKEERKNAR